MQGATVNRYRQTTQATETFVKSKPWQSVGLAVAAGVIVGFLAGRR
jgi:ElaB/YqjD/DUF883 family membrane-anchored ribosome-binding protein